MTLHVPEAGRGWLDMEKWRGWERILPPEDGLVCPFQQGDGDLVTAPLRSEWLIE